jgi:cellulose synthase/poly-beta-1,6-N-acetylglucosamine synthase-like glycosyltransferase
MLILSSFLLGWVFYNLPPLLVGVRQIRKGKCVFDEPNKNEKLEDLPFFSLIVPMKDEEKVARRILDAMVKINYPSDKYELIVVDDSLADDTSKICKEFESAYPRRVRYFHRDISWGKPSALNYGLKFAKGEIVGVFDADNVPDPDVLLKAAKHFETKAVVAIQGLLSSINAEENMLTKIINYEGLIQHYAFLSGKDKLGLFVPFSGTCLFVRRDVLNDVGGWLDGALSEDMELSARLTEKGYSIRFAPDVRSWQENPSKFNQLIRQRERWFRGCIDVAFKYGKLLKRMDRRSLDAEVFFAGPCVMVLVLITYVLSGYMIFVPLNLGAYTNIVAQFMSLLTFFTLFIIGVGLASATKPRRISNVKWLPFMYLYWTTQVFVAFYALLETILGRPRKWTKTSRTGVITNKQLAQSLHSS